MSWDEASPYRISHSLGEVTVAVCDLSHIQKLLATAHREICLAARQGPQESN
jgi:hypothetical protein